MKHFGNLEDREAVAHAFDIDISELDGCKLIFAAYETGDYSGSALILFERDGKLYEVNGSHCSCYGLEDQWSPEETCMEALRMRDLAYYGFDKSLEDLFIDLVFEKEVLEK